MSRKKANKIGLFLGPVLFVIVIFIPVDEIGQQLSFEARIVIATTLWMGTWWITEAIPNLCNGSTSSCRFSFP